MILADNSFLEPKHMCFLVVKSKTNKYPKEFLYYLSFYNSF